MDADRLYGLLWAFAPQRVLTTAGRAGILDRLAAGPARPEALAAALGLDPAATGKVVRALCALGIARRDADGAYGLDPGIAALFPPGGGGLQAFVDHSHHLYDRWGETLEEWLRTGSDRPRERTPDGLRAFADAMRAGASLTAPRAAEALGLGGVRRMLDVGGGTGAWSEAFCRAGPGLEAVVVDTPAVAELGREAARAAGLGDRISFAAGDWDEVDPGGGFDLVLLANVLHVVQADAARRMVARAAAALAPGGRVAVVDFRIDDAKDAVLQGALFAINMLSHGDTWSFPEIRQWMEAAGLGDVARTDLTASHWLVAGRKG